MVLEYWGLAVSEDELVELSETTELGTDRFKLVEAALKVGLEADTFLGISLEEVDKAIRDGLPIIALIDPSELYGGIAGVGHFVVIIGLKKDAVFYHDPAMGDHLSIARETFERAWREFDCRGIRVWKPTKR